MYSIVYHKKATQDIPKLKAAHLDLSLIHISYAKITKIEIEYTDGTTATISLDDIQYVTY